MQEWTLIRTCEDIETFQNDFRELPDYARLVIYKEMIEYLDAYQAEITINGEKTRQVEKAIYEERKPRARRRRRGVL